MKRALLVGIDSYDHFGALGGCVNDVRAAEPLLSRNDEGSPNFNCQRRTSSAGRVTRDSLLTDVDALLAPGADTALLYFAGHGNGRQADVVLATQDGSPSSPGVGLSEIMTKVVDSPVSEVVLILDCCYAGAAGGVPQLALASASLRSGVSILAASRGDQTAAETLDGRGLFSKYLCGAFDGGAADVLGKVTLAGLYAYLDESFGPWDQRPVFKANVDRLHALRSCEPPVKPEHLRRLPEFFPQPDLEFPLGPSYEPTAEPRIPEHEAIFAILQNFRAVKLLAPVGTAHMYYAAMESRSCRLTALGQHYWHMGNESRL